MENFTKFNSATTSLFGRFNWKTAMLLLAIVVIGMLAMSYNFNEDFLTNNKMLSAKIQRLKE
ncbi:XcGVORF176-like protein [Hyphantria cunea granulovirus]|uniref:XcGVORF176-like protein n=1 Tax=Hyphantria cunea granulovirus TaxID=307448 RepID=A0AAE6D0P1_9BBAC|nr:XcGVORF176-like protein [Hyphantria cunea granulovirus]QBQ01680.1 XcGVORF176-like protein [Hyphantria cunea granulovirus]